ncbi:hypothetical protein [Paractinoplanes durhamensis]|uniref:Uncharacterized protein n=1 Tax=Paractinoplanes durhamensis TaxID=113563 RepID=A0ABQ3YQT6_9ACTN|nr:hypothetical protein [Actinoplanes durhamensis]GID99907.1 hypothetical protein Adu01nite_12580 [Actinoplanes durhamensis]
MPVIDLDAPARPAPTRSRRVPIMLAAALALLSLPGEPGTSPDTFNEDICAYLNRLPGSGSVSVAIDPSSGDVLQTTTIQGGCINH